MKTIDDVSAEKLRGGFYSPKSLVAVCLERIDSLVQAACSLRVLEPSAGDGAFLRGLAQHRLSSTVSSVTAVEIIGAEAERCLRTADAAPFSVDVRCGSSLDASLLPDREFDVVLGNPPFVRFQFISDRDRRHVEDVAKRMGITVRGVSNLWIPILINALDKLRDGGAFAVIVPAECLTGISASIVRTWLLENVANLKLDIFSPGSFPGVLQEVVVLSGTRNPALAASELIVHEHSGNERCWKHVAAKTERTWMRYLLTPAKILVLEEASNLKEARPLGEMVRFSVATVTGANGFFSVNSDTVDDYDLSKWTRPLLPRIRNAPGLIFSSTDHQRNVDSELRAQILDFSMKPDPSQAFGAARYLSMGEGEELHRRYKCRIRSPWYNVPIVPPADILLSKRCHLYPRVVLNDASVITTDTIYQGRTFPGCNSGAFVASFHNSLTLLCAEIEGRSFGGGVLELVPSEVARLRVFEASQMVNELSSLDIIARNTNPEEDDSLTWETDRRLTKHIPGLNDSLITTLAEARCELQRRRLERSRAASENIEDAECVVDR